MMTNPLELVVNDIDIITKNLQESVNAIYGLDEVSYKDLDEIISDMYKEKDNLTNALGKLNHIKKCFPYEDKQIGY